MRRLRALALAAIALTALVALPAQAIIRLSVKTVDAVSMGASVTSSIVDHGSLTSSSLQCIWTGTPEGTWAFQVSNNYDVARPSNATWTAVTLDAPPAAAAGSASNFFADLTDLPGRSFRLVYTRTASTGTLNCHFHGKGE